MREAETSLLMRLAHRAGYFGVFYLVILLVLVVGFPLAQQFAKPLAAMIFPINEQNSLLKMVLVVSAMYWGVALAGGLFSPRGR